MARVKFIRDEEPNIRSLETNGGAIDGALYVATDTGNMWMGTDSNSLLKLSNPVIVEVDPYASKVTQEQYDTIAASWPNVMLKAGQAFLRPASSVVVESTTAFHFAAPGNKGFKNINLSFSNTFRGSIYPDLSAIFGGNTLSLANPSVSDGYGIMSADATTLECSTKGKISIKDNGVTTAKITDGAVTKAKLGSDIVIPTTKADIGLENVDNTADVNKSVKYATSAGSANTASVANSVAWDNVTGAPTIPNTDSFVLHEAINEYTAPDNKLNVELISGLDEYISNNINYPEATETTFGGVYASVNSSTPEIMPLGHVYSQKNEGLLIESINEGAISSNHLVDGAITTAKIVNGAVTKAKLGADVPVIYSSTSEPTSTDGKDGDVWIVYEA